MDVIIAGKPSDPSDNKRSEIDIVPVKWAQPN